MWRLDDRARSASTLANKPRGDEATLALRLFVADDSTSSVRARQQVERLQERFDAGGWEVQVVDVLERPDLAEEERVLATPSLVRRRPSPPRKIVGDLSDWEVLTAALGLSEARDE